LPRRGERGNQGGIPHCGVFCAQFERQGLRLTVWLKKQTEWRDRVQSGRTDAHAPSAQKAASSLRQLRFLRATKRQVGDALFHFASITVGSPAFIPDPVDLLVVAAHIEGRVDNRGNEMTASIAMPISLMRASS